MRRLPRISLTVSLLLILLQVVSPLGASIAAPATQFATPEERAQTLLESLTPEERVGQLFLVTFTGTDAGPDSQIYDLIVNRHIGGVVLTAANDNFTDIENTPAATQQLILELQRNEWLGSLEDLVNPTTLETYRPVFIPLVIGISQLGDGYPNDQIYNGLTQLPSPMAIGATWQPSLAERVGFVVGQELSAMGFNLLLGPALDVLESPNPDSAGDLGVRTFGGDPFWVGQMGSAYIQGVHQGSEGKIAVVGKHFPGHGGSDRPPEEEVSTVRKSLEQLKQIELAPFFAVTGNAASPEKTVDALLISHIRYQGFQGNIRATTRPISFDEQAFSDIMSLAPFSTWRENGGVIITDNLGSRAVRRFYDPSGLDFKAWQVARDAFLAGSDMLFVGEILDSSEPDTYSTILSILEFFTQKYREDVAFAQRVDESVLRILTLKFKIYDTFSLENVLPDESDLDLIGNSEQVSFDVARQGASLISPSLSDLDSVLPDAPGLNDRIVFVSDTYTFQQCSQCPEQPVLPFDAFQQAVLRLYGLEAGNQVLRQNLFSFTFEDLQAMLDNPGRYHAIEVRMRSAQWVVFTMLDVRGDRPASQALRGFLSERDDLIRDKNVVVFALNAPYYLDATEISKITAYYGLYSKSPQFIDTAARILFKEFTPIFGAIPVSVPGIGYDLISATSPDPDQAIPVLLDVPEQEVNEEELTPQPPPLPEFQVGDTIPIRTGIIVDHNGNPVPDGTLVQFVFNLAGETTFSAPVETVQGVARTTYLIDGSGPLEIRAISEPANQSLPLQMDIPGLEVTVGPTASPSPTQAQTTTPAPTATEPPPPPPAPPQPEPRSKTDLIDWGLAFLVTIAISLAALRVGTSLGHSRWSLRWGLCAWIGGLLTYTYLSLSLPGSESVLIGGGRFGLVWVVALGAGLGWGAGWLWRALQLREKSKAKADPPSFAKTKSG